MGSPEEEVQNIASKGGQSSHNSGFASMDADKQVIITTTPIALSCDMLTMASARHCLEGWPDGRPKGRASFQRLI